MRFALLTIGIVLAASAVADPPRYQAPTPGSYELPTILRVDEHQLLGPDRAPASATPIRSATASAK